ncbi:nonphototropic hypocotyl protein [Medicago truncatula]|uniref:non-specific serine/threonine protein kinase n=1 Tax=Medicago truncatula TaxID=3880 RepID=G7JSJ7_MEDTR|nr:nonphototropic hypocotyl protein [Medicago truncatula]
MKQKVKVMEPFTRDHRGSLEVFNPSSSDDNNNENPNPINSWNTWTTNSRPNETPQQPTRDSINSDEVPVATSWMALKETTSPSVSNEPGSAAAQRAAEWGLVLKTDSETGKPQGVAVRSSGGGSRRDSNNSMRSSGESSDEGREFRGIPRVSEDLRDALSAFQQTFVVSDATKPDYPIMYASAGFFNMTGYTSKEVIGRNCRFMQGADTDPNDVAKIRESLAAGTTYCGRLLNYKKDGTPFWNLLTIAPIKDENGKILKLIGMQVEVSKHTEGTKEKMLRPNGLPKSLIRYDARQKEKANSSVNELVEAVSRRPRSLSESANRPPFIKVPTKTVHSSDHATQELQKTPSKSSRRRKSESTLPSFRRKSHSGGGGDTHFNSMHPITETPENKINSRRRSFMGFIRKSLSNNESFNDEQLADDEDSSEDDERPDSVDEKIKKREKRKGLDLATTLERIEKNFVITDPRLPDNPIIFASDSFLELTEYSREEILGRNCRFLQGPETDPATVKKIRQAIDNQTEVTVQLINYTKSGKKFWNLFHLQPMRDQKGEVQYFIGVQLDGSQHVEPLHNRIAEDTAKEGENLVKKTAENVDDALRELPDANMKPEDLWMNHSKVVHPKPHRRDDAAWRAIQKIMESGEQIGLKHFKPIKPLGVHLVELCGTDQHFAMKAMEKAVMLNRNKVHRACTEREILDMLDHPFLPALYASFQTKTHICLITDYCPGGELFLLLERQPSKGSQGRCSELSTFYAAEVVTALEYLHCQGIIYRDLKPENVLLQRSGHVSLTDFDLSCLTSCKPQLLISTTNDKKKGQQAPIFMAEPMRASNSFVGTEEYIAPEIITGSGHTSAVDWWALGILLYEMIYGYTPFRGKNRQRTFANILHKDLRFPKNKQVSLSAKQLIYRLLQRDPTSRLGSNGGANDIKNHPFFRGINWALVRCTKPPELDAPLFDTNEEEKGKEKEDKYVDIGQENMSVF